MIGIILSAGYGSRLLPLTSAIPKCLVSVEGRAILDHQIHALAEAGVEEAVVVVGYRHAQVERFLERPLPIRASALFNPFWSVASSIGSVWVARGHLAGEFCLMNGDTVFDPAVLREALTASSPGEISLLVEPLGEHEIDDMLVRVEDGRVREVSKALLIAEATHRSLGVVVNRRDDRAYLHALDEVIAEDGGYGAYHHAVIDRLARGAGVAAVLRRHGAWQEIDRVEDIRRWTHEHEVPGR